MSLVNEDILNWHAVIAGPENSPYEGGSFTVLLTFPDTYPFKAPDIKFVTKIYHPNVSSAGAICAELIHATWGPTLNVSHVLGVLRNMLATPNLDSPVDDAIAAEARDNPAEFDRKARAQTKAHAMDK